jgi:hypothetical protein
VFELEELGLFELGELVEVLVSVLRGAGALAGLF